LRASRLRRETSFSLRSLYGQWLPKGSRVALRLLSMTVLLACSVLMAGAYAQSNATLHLVFVLDGLRPDSIDPTETPNLYRLRKEGVAFEHTHAVFPTVTRVNATSLGSGMYPAHHGIMGNSIYVPAVDPRRAFTNSNYERLLELDEATSGRMVTATGIAERMQAAGRTVVVVSSGGTGSALLLAPKAHRGTGIVINGDIAGGGYPASLGETILRRFGPPPKKGGKEPYDKSVDWALDVLREHVIPEMKPAVVYTWLTEPDHVQHGFGIGSREARASIRNDDRHIGAVLQKLDQLGIRDKTNVIVVSDHGFGQTGYVVNVTEALTNAGFMKPDSDDVVLASSGQAISLHVKGRDPKRIAEIVQYLQGQKWCGVVFTSGKRGGADQ
jgi:predicted AlkP superfamily pyrophosphatase or phosphodiesterase